MPLSITPIATTIDLPYLSALVSDDGKGVPYPHGFEATEGTMPADALTEFAGRACYQSWSRPNPATATNEGYIENVLDHEHFSVFEHASVTLYVEGVSRALTHELVRHRHFSPSQLSQRFVDESNVTFVVPPAVRDMYLRAGLAPYEIEEAWNSKVFFEEVRDNYKMLVDDLTREGLSRKEIREAARAVLPNCTETKIVLTGNLRCWMEFFKKRDAEGVDREMREFAQAAYDVVRRAAPNTFAERGPVPGVYTPEQVA